MNDQGEYESASEKEVGEENVDEDHEEQKHTGCELEQEAALVVAQILSV